MRHRDGRPPAVFDATKEHRSGGWETHRSNKNNVEYKGQTQINI